MAEPNGRPQVDDESRRYMRKYGYAAWQAWQAAGRPGPPPPEVDADEDQAGDEPVRCHACGALFTGYHCDECGTPATPTPGRLLHGLALSRTGLPMVGVLVLLPVAIVQYAISPEGQSQLPLLLALILGPLAITLAAWCAYRRWYRGRYPEDR